MNLTDQIKEYKEKIEALASKAALADSFKEQFEAITAEKSAMIAELQESKAAVVAANAEKESLAATIDELRTKISAIEADKKAADEKALEIVAGLGLNQIPVVTITNTEKPTAEQIREKYISITDSVEKAKFYAENRQAILHGVNFDN